MKTQANNNGEHQPEGLAHARTNIGLAALAAGFTAAKVPSSPSPEASATAAGTSPAAPETEDPAQPSAPLPPEAAPETEATQDQSEVTPEPILPADPEPAPEAPADPDAETTPDVVRLSDLPRDKREFYQRVNELTRQKRELEERLAEALRTPFKEPEAEAHAAWPRPASGPLAKLDEQIAQREAALEFAAANPGGAQAPDGQYYDAEAVARIERNARNDLIRLNAERAVEARNLAQAEAAARQQVESLLAQHYPAVLKNDTEDGQFVAQAQQRFPQLAEVADWKLFAAWANEGRKAFMARMQQQQAQRPAPRTRPASPTPVVGAAAAAAPRVNAKAKELKEQEARWQQSGRRDDLAKFFASQRAARLAPA